MSANFLMLQNILAELKRVNSITDLKEYYKDEWEFYDLLMDLANDKNFKRACIDRSFSHDLKKDLDCYIRLANQAKKTASNYFRRKDVKLQAFYNDTNKVLNINLIHYNKNEPVRIGDILQQERDISALNIYCDKKHDIYVYRKGNKRHYEFEEGAYYEMTSTWSVQNKHGKTFTCTMVMNVSSVGIIEVLQFNGKGFELPSKKFWELIRQNEELYIQSLSLHDAVKALLEKNKNAPVVHDLQNNEHIIINQDKNLKDLENDAKDNPIPSFASNNVPAQQVAAQVIHPIATQTEVNLQHTETQTEVAVQYVETQTGIGFKQAETQTKVDLQEVAIQTEVNSQQLDQKLTKAEQEIKGLNEQRNELRYRLDKTEQEFKELEKHNSDLQDKFGEEKQKKCRIAS
ncbi:MAG: hypothetical protein ACR5KV_07650 [Wolbachia sp.]